MLHSLRVFGWPEDVDGVVWRTERFHSLIALHAVVQGWSHAVNTQERILNESRGGPFSSLNRVVGLNVTGDFAMLEESRHDFSLDAPCNT